MEAYPLMLGTVLFGHDQAVGNKLLEGRVDDNLLGDGVAGKLPDELVLPSDFGVFILGSEDSSVLLLELGMIVLDAVRDLDGAVGGVHHGADADGLDKARGCEGGAGNAVGDASGDLPEAGVGCQAIHIYYMAVWRLRVIVSQMTGGLYSAPRKSSLECCISVTGWPKLPHGAVMLQSFLQFWPKFTSVRSARRYTTDSTEGD